MPGVTLIDFVGLFYKILNFLIPLKGCTCKILVNLNQIGYFILIPDLKNLLLDLQLLDFCEFDDTVLFLDIINDSGLLKQVDYAPIRKLVLDQLSWISIASLELK
jgi:hypothetical protein